MNLLVATALLCLSFVSLSFQQPPGVPPKGHNQQFQQQQQHHQQQQEQQQHGQAQPQGGHGHEHGRALHFSSEVHNADHILEHLQHVVATKKKEDMTEEELEFHYFKLHDYDNNNKLDGVEIGKALTHFHDEAEKPDADAKVFSDQEISNIVDSVFSENDENLDGYIEYTEFKRRQSATRNRQQPPEQQQQQQQQQQYQQPPQYQQP